MAVIKQSEFRAAMVIGVDENVLDAIELLTKLTPTTRFNWLLSYKRMLPVESLSAMGLVPENTFVDSDGYPIVEGTKLPSSVPPEKYARLLMRLRPGFAVSPDAAPVWGASAEELDWFNKERFEEFYDTYEANEQTKILDPIHGDVFSGYETFTLEHRDRWIESIERYSGGIRSGWAIKLFMRDKGWSFKVAAHYAMQAWSLGASTCHILGVGGTEFLPIAAYLGRKCYLTMSLDTSSYTLSAERNKLYVYSTPAGGIQVLPLSAKKFKNMIAKKLMRGCLCEVCGYFKDKGEPPLQQLILEMHSDKKADRNETLSFWLLAHNALLFQRAVDRWVQASALKVDDYKNFIVEQTVIEGNESVKTGKANDVAKILDAIDHVEEMHHKGPVGWRKATDYLRA